MIQPTWTIAANTFVESIRQPIYSVLLVIGGLGMMLMPSLTAYSMDEDLRFLMELGISWLYTTTVLLAAFTATGVITREIENRTVLTVLTKPVPRPIFILGKFMGVSLAIFLAMWTLALLFALIIRHGVMSTASDRLDWPVILLGSLAALGAVGVSAAMNYLYQHPFTSRFVLYLAGGMTVAAALLLFIDKDFAFQSPAVEFGQEGMFQAGQIPAAVLLVGLSAWFLTGVAIAASTRLSQAATLAVTLIAVAIGMIGRAGLVGGLVDGNPMLDSISRIIPDLLLLWPGDALAQQRELTGSFLLSASAYALSLVAATVMVAIALFQRRQLG
ncbi:MAG: ABC transporter permease [Phycisphaeraceae bacterium]|nr:ABC transporter permease [Phycisphaeraceae bacterium]